MLEGYEVKPIKAGNVSIGEGHCYFKGNELFLTNLTVTESKRGTTNTPKKLLLNRKELNELSDKVAQKGLTIIPLKLYMKQALIKIEIGLCKGKKNYDKRESIKAKDIKRQNDREV
jgi:SsrA-binding protein